MRGALSGLYNSAGSLGRFIGPAGFATTFAWSISPSSYHWVNYSFVFYTSAALSGSVAVLAWQNFTLETLTQPQQRKKNRRPLRVRVTEQTFLRSHKVPVHPVAGGYTEAV